MDTYYFVVCEYRSKGGETVIKLSNCILKDIHPLVWAASADQLFYKFFTIYILFWEAIPESIALDPNVQKYFARSSREQYD